HAGGVVSARRVDRGRRDARAAHLSARLGGPRDDLHPAGGAGGDLSNRAADGSRADARARAGLGGHERQPYRQSIDDRGGVPEPAATVEAVESDRDRLTRIQMLVAGAGAQPKIRELALEPPHGPAGPLAAPAPALGG